MRCENCGKNVAAVHMTQIVNGIKTVRHLCVQCAAPIAPMNFASFFASPVLPKSCPSCGTTFVDFNKTGLFGCPDCYTFFENDLIEPLKNLHGAFLHVDTNPEADELAALKKRLQEAIATENYEEAARLRDCIKEMKADD